MENVEAWVEEFERQREEDQTEEVSQEFRDIFGFVPSEVNTTRAERRVIVPPELRGRLERAAGGNVEYSHLIFIVERTTAETRPFWRKEKNKLVRNAPGYTYEVRVEV